MQKKLIAFDMDGTLIDSAQATGKCLSFLHNMLGLDTPSPEDLRGIHGDNASEILRCIVLKKTCVPEMYVRDLVKWANHIYPTYYMWRYSRRVPGVAETLGHLSNLGYVIIISSNVGNAVREFIREENIGAYVGPPSAQSEFESKRDRLLQAQRIHKVPSASTVYVGDTISDMMLGKELGVKTIAVTGSSANSKEIERMATGVVKSITEIPKTLRIWERKKLLV